MNSLNHTSLDMINPPDGDSCNYYQITTHLFERHQIKSNPKNKFVTDMLHLLREINNCIYTEQRENSVEREINMFSNISIKR